MTASRELQIGLIVLLLLGLWRGWARRGAPWTEQLAEALLPALLGALAFAYYETTVLNTRWIWSACRLAPTIGLFHGYPLYSPVEAGPINGWLYGPVAAIFWTPAALADSPLTALAIAAVINLVFLLFPLLAAGRRVAPNPGLPRLLAFVFGAAALLQVYPTWYMASALNADAIAVGLGAGSCLLLLSENPPGGKRLMLAALLSVLAAWTKQIEAPLVLAQIGWLWFRHGRKAALEMAAACTGAMLAVAAVVFLLLKAPDVIFNMWTVPAAHARPGGWSAARAEVVDFCRYTVILWLPCLIALWLHARASRAGSPDHPPKTRHPLLLFVVAAAVLLPFGVLAAIKVGGDRNSMHSVYYLVVAATMALAGAWPTLAMRQAVMLRTALLLAAVSLAVLVVRQVAGYAKLTMLPTRCLSQEAWLFAQEQPGRVYFPWDPLATLMAEGRMYHFEYGVLDRLYAGRAPTDGRISQDLPSRLGFVVYPKANYPKTMLDRYLPQYVFATATEDWLIYRRNGSK